MSVAAAAAAADLDRFVDYGRRPALFATSSVHRQMETNANPSDAMTHYRHEVSAVLSAPIIYMSDAAVDGDRIIWEAVLLLSSDIFEYVNSEFPTQ